VKLELHDSDTHNSLSGRVPKIDYDYQAEMFVHDSYLKPDIVRWELHDSHGLRCVWERPVGSTEMPVITKRSPRFAGEWHKSPNEVTI
jgi:hypothetical protein